MKTLLCIFIVLFYAREVISEGFRFKRLATENLEQFLKDLNEKRQQLGKVANVTMKQLRYSHWMESIASNLSSDCDTWKHGNYYRLAPTAFDHNADSLFTIVMGLINPTNRGHFNTTKPRSSKERFLNDVFLMFIELFLPEHTEIGCVKKECTGKVPKDVAVAFGLTFDKYKFTEVCAMTPQKRVTEDLIVNLMRAEKKIYP